MPALPAQQVIMHAGAVMHTEEEAPSDSSRLNKVPHSSQGKFFPPTKLYGNNFELKVREDLNHTMQYNEIMGV